MRHDPGIDDSDILDVVDEVDLRRLEEIRRNWPFLRDRRIDAYDGLTSRHIGG